MSKSTDVVYAGASLRERQDYAIALSKAGELIPRGLRDPNGTPNAGKILLVTEYGNALGIHPIVAINGIDIIEGRLTITPALMSGLIRDAGHKLRVSTDGTGQQLTATAILVRADDPQHPFKVTWTMADAKAAGLDGKQNWKKYPRAMLKARAISEVAREGAEDVLMGTSYNADEMGAETNEAGEVIDAEIVEQDHDGPQVVRVMRETGTPSNVKAAPGVANETEVQSRSDAKSTPQRATRTSRPRTDPVAGTADPAREVSRKAYAEADAVQTRKHADVWAEWQTVVDTATDMNALIRAHDDAAKRGVLDITSNGTSIEDVFLSRREELQAAAAGEPEPAPDDNELY